MRDSSISSKTKSLLNWGNEFGVKRYGWNPLRGANICFVNEIEAKSKLSLCIEPKRFCFNKTFDLLLSESASGFFFAKNEKTGKIDLTHCVRSTYNTDIRTTYSNCTYFGMTTILNQKSEVSVFEMTCAHRDVQFSIGIDFKLCSNYKEIVDSINVLIHSVLNCEEITTESPTVSPLCTILDNYDGLGLRLMRGVETSTSILDIYPPCCIDSVNMRKFSFDYAVRLLPPYYIDSTMIEIQSFCELTKKEKEVTAVIIDSSPIVVLARWSFNHLSDINGSTL